MSFFIGDTLHELEINVSEDMLVNALSAAATIHLPGQAPVTATAAIDEDTETVTVSWPDDLPLEIAGIGRAVIRLTYPDASRTVAVQRFVIEELSGWYTLYEMREDWEQSPTADYKAAELLTLAREQCLEYAPLPESAGIPEAHRQAQLMQARNIWNSARVDPANAGIEGENFIIQPYPLDWMIKQILRPKRGGLITGTETDDD